jgi:hypothetical protein
LSRRTLVWMIPIALTLHNVEEALAFRRMWPRLGAILPEPFARVEGHLPLQAMLQALAALSVLGFVLAAFVAVRPQEKSGWWLLLALEVALAINAVAHVASALFLFHGYAPGLITALVLNAPLAVYCLGRGRKDRWVSERAWRAAFVGGVVLHGPVLLGALWLAGALVP